MKKTALLILLMSNLVFTMQGATISLTSNNKSDYSIYVESSVTQDVHNAAIDLQYHLELATGVRLPITSEARGKIISIGVNKELAKTRLNQTGYLDNELRIGIYGDNLYLYGRDESKRPRWQNDRSIGTQYAVTEFLESFVGFRFLAPGIDFTYIPKLNRLQISLDREISQHPYFVSRNFNERKKDQEWAARLRTGGSFNAGHSWDDYVSVEEIKKHPEFLAMQADGIRSRGLSGNRVYANVKYCTSNKQLLDTFAENVKKHLFVSPPPKFKPISPSDGAGWCACGECKKMIDLNIDPAWGHFFGFKSSATPLVMNFYSEILKRVAPAMKEGQYLTGYVYYDYILPPQNQMKLPPKMALQIAILRHYGLTLYKPEYQAELHKLLDYWSTQTDFMTFYGAATWLRSGLGTPLGTQKELLDFIMNTAQKYKFKGMSIYLNDWGSNAVFNYLAAKKMWDPSLDSEAVINDFLKHAYGAGALEMRKIYILIDEKIKAYKIKTPAPRAEYEMTPEMVREVYAPIYPQIEELFVSAKNKAKTPLEKKMFQEFEDVLVILCFNLNNAELLINGKNFALYRDEAGYGKFMQTDSNAVQTVKLAGEQGGITVLCPPGKKSMSILNINKNPAPIIDGELNDPVWSYARGAEQGLADAQGFVHQDTGNPIRDFTRITGSYDAENIYFGVYCKDNNVITDNSSATAGDYVSLTFSDDLNSTAVQLNFNAAGKLEALQIDEGQSKPLALKCNYKTMQVEGAWTAEIAIDIASLKNCNVLKKINPNLFSTKWQGNFVRYNQPNNEVTVWSFDRTQKKSSGILNFR
jgi:hypothetical protein